MNNCMIVTLRVTKAARVVIELLAGALAILLVLLLLAVTAHCQTNSATFVKFDTTTQGKWTGVYGAGGSSFAGIAAVPPGALVWTWAYSTSDPRSISVNASTWYNGSFSVDVQFQDALQHQVAIYAVDWDSTARSERIDVLDGATGAVLNSQTISGFHNGTYVVWQAAGHVKLQFTSVAGANAVLSGFFLDPVPAQASPAVIFITSGAEIVAQPCPAGWTGPRQVDGSCMALKLP
jgi:hypothetical protein